MTETASDLPPVHATGARALEQAIDEAEDEVKRWERAVLAARTPDAEERARDALTRAELALDALLDARGDCGSCEGWPKGK